MTLDARLPEQESLTVEFKSDRQCIADKELVEALVCLANSEGGDLWLGVEDDGTPSGLHEKHQNLLGLAGLVAARTSPSLLVSVHEHFMGDKKVARIVVPKTPYVVATTAGVYLYRRLQADSTPECVPMMPHDITSRQSYLGLNDASSRPVAGASLADFDPLERERLRQTIRRYDGDRSLLSLDDEALEDALHLVTRNDAGERVPTLAGLLMIGREEVLRTRVSTHEFAFQVLAREMVRFNEFQRFPLLKAMDWLETNFRPYNPENEVQVGLFRVPVPMVDGGAFREALANAFIHRDYHRMGAIHVILGDDGLTVSNPGGLMEGVTIHNLLVTPPRPRNPLLADAMKRIGLVERTGRGVDKIYRGMLKFGRPLPDYSRTDPQQVVVQLATTEADVHFLRMVMTLDEQYGEEMPIDSLIVLSMLHRQKRMDMETLAHAIQRDVLRARSTVEKLVEYGLVQAHGNARARTYTLSADVYRAEGNAVGYTRQAGLGRVQQEQLILAHVQHHGRVERKHVMALCFLTEKQATTFLKQMVKEGKLKKHAHGKYTFYSAPENKG